MTKATSTNALQSLANAVTNDIRDIRPPVEIPSGWAWLWWVFGAVALAALAYAAWRYWQKRLAEQPAAPIIPPHVRAKQKLQEALALLRRPEPFVVAVSSAVRVYLEERFEFRAPERTTEEFLHELKGTPLLSTRQQESLGDFLTRSDLVKFAKYEPGEPELLGMHAAAVRLVEETQAVPELPLSEPPSPSLDATSNTQHASAAKDEDEGGGRARDDSAFRVPNSALE
jgi:hypothetical protein